MNHYDQQAKQHWRRHLPAHYRRIQDPDSFFSTLGEQAAQQIGDLTLDLAGEDPPGEDYQAKLGRLNMARLRAEELVRQRLLPLPEDEQEKEEAADQGWIPLVEDPTHPWWRQVDSQEQISQEPPRQRR
jgi:hypothetical protein